MMQLPRASAPWRRRRSRGAMRRHGIASRVRLRAYGVNTLMGSARPGLLILVVVAGCTVTANDSSPRRAEERRPLVVETQDGRSSEPTPVRGRDPAEPAPLPPAADPAPVPPAADPAPVLPI